jgi:hypothetical protein
LFPLASSLKITEVDRIFWLLFPRLGLCINHDKMRWASFWAIFSQAHLVTLVWKPTLNEIQAAKKREGAY